jgi:uncharacterized membrane protein (DUF485 family)
MGHAVKGSGAEIPAGAWMEGIQSSEFKALIDAKVRSIAPMVVIYIVSYMGLSILAGFGRDMLGAKVLGPINLGFVIIIANYVISWLLAIAYARVSARVHDPLVKTVIEKARMKGRAS